MTQQEPITIIAPILAERKDTLFTFLKQVRTDLQKGMHESFENIGTIHYARWLVIDYDIEKGVSKMGDMPKLVFSSNFDGEIEQQVKDLCTTAADIMDAVFECCEGYPPKNERTVEKRIAYLNKHRVPPSAFYRGAPMRTLSQIKNENRLRDFIRNFLDAKQWNNYSAKEVQQEIKNAVFAKAEFEWVKTPVKLPGINWPGMILLGVILLILLPVIIIWILIVEFGYERHDTYFTLKRSQLNQQKMKELESYEDFEMQNQFSQLVTMKPGKVRLITYKALMLFARTLISFKFVEGKLMGIPTIHFARWVMFDDNKRVLFFSNFDGSWQQYLGDFIDKSGWGLTGIFSNTTNFPKTRFLFTGGAYDEEHFLAWSRNSEVSTQIWYCAYPHLNIKNVNNNSRIRSELIKDLSETEAANFLKLI